MDSPGINRNVVRTSLNEAMQVHRLVGLKKAVQYETKNSIAESLPPPLENASQIWQSEGASDVLRRASDLLKVNTSLQYIYNHFSSAENPFAEHYKNHNDYQAFLDRIKPGGRFDRDLQEDKYDHNPNARRDTMKQVVHFFIDLDKVSKVDPERAFSVIGFFPSPFEADYQCAGGMGSRLIQARSLLMNMPDKVLLGPYQAIKEHLQIQLAGVVSAGDEVHLPQALDVLFGLPIELVQKTDPQFGVPFLQISSPKVWQSYRQSLNMGKEIADLIKTQSRQAIMRIMDDGHEAPSTSITSTNEKMYLKPWGLSVEDLYHFDVGLYDEMYLPQKKTGETDDQFSARLSSRLASLMSKKLNESLFSQDESKYIPWLSLQPVDLTEIPDAAGLLFDHGRQWVTRQINRGLTETTEPPELEVALNAMLIMGERTAHSYPAMVIKVLHELGDEDGIQQGMACLSQLKQKFPQCAHFVNRIQEISQSNLQGSYREYGDFLQRGSPAPLLTMLKGGASREELCQAIRSERARVNEVDNYGCTPLFLATAINEIDVVRALLEHAGMTTLNHAELNGKTPVFIATENGHNDILSLLAANGSVDINHPDRYGMTPLMSAARMGNTQAMDILLNTGRCSLNASNQRGRTALTLSIEYGQLAAVELLLGQASIDISSVDDENRTPLHLAAMQHHNDIVLRLLQKSIQEINVADSGGITVLFRYISHGDVAMVNRLLSYPNLDLNKVDNNGCTPLMVAIGFDERALVEALLNHPVHPGQAALQVNAIDSTGYTALYYAVSNAQEGIVRLLIAHPEIDVNIVDSLGNTPLHQAAGDNHLAVLDILFEHPQIEVNPVNNHNATPLWVAASHNCLDCVQRLLSHGADKSIANNIVHMTPVDIARINGYDQVATLIENF